MKLKVFRDLEFYGNDSSFSQLIEGIEKRLSNGWTRSREDENHISGAFSKIPYCFQCSEYGERKSALLWLMDKYYEDQDRNYQTLYVANIVPIENQQLSYDQYNYILKEFFEKFAKPVAEELHIDSKLTDDEQGIDNWISESVEEKLLAFSHSANKSTGSSHPSDEKKWFDFIVATHKENATLNSEILQRWLIEIENWNEEVAWNLISEYESARRLLNFYDRERYDS